MLSIRHYSYTRPLYSIKKEKAIDYEVLSFQEKAAEQADESGKKSNYYKEICKAYLATNQLPKALEAVTKALEAKSKDIETLFLQALIHYKQKEFANVIETLDLIISHTQDEKSLSRFYLFLVRFFCSLVYMADSNILDYNRIL